MTLTTSPPATAPPPKPPRSRRRRAALVAAAVLAAGGLGAGLALSLGGASTPTSTSAFTYYQQMMGRFGVGQMMGGSDGWMGTSGYGWMMGGASAPGWMRGGSLPGFMMGTSTDPGKVMGRLFADAPGPRVSPAQAVTLGDQIPPGASVDRAADRITFGGRSVTLAVVASPAANPDETFRMAGMVNPTIVVLQGAQVSVEFVNADADIAHGLVVTSNGAASSWMPMMSAAPTFSGSALWFLGNPTSAGMHEGTLSFTATQAGTYQYLCPVPGHAQKGMVGTFVVSSGS